MEVGAVKQAFNNEVILLKKKLNQAKIQVIHKLTRKAKSLVEKKCTDTLKEKFNRKAESAVNEVLIIKKIKPKDVAKFALTHKGNLEEHLNKPTVDHDKACARLLLHKSLQDKYKFMRSRFSSIPIEDLFMSREERRKLKKEAKEKQKNKKKSKDNSDSKVVNAEGKWDVEDVDMSDSFNTLAEEELSEDEESKHVSEDEAESDKEEEIDEQASENSSDKDDSVSLDQEMSDEETSSPSKLTELQSNNSEDEGNEILENVGKYVTLKSAITVQNNTTSKINTKDNLKTQLKNKPERKLKVKNRQDKNKNLKEKLQSRKFKKELEKAPMQETKIVDPFFITSTGENYMSVVEPRPPDEVKEVHKQGNRKLRRAAMFGHVPKIKPRHKNYESDNNKFSKQNGFSKNNSSNNQNWLNDDCRYNNDNRKFNVKGSNYNKYEPIETKPEKLHPSWEAKKKKSGLLPFEGKKIVFDES